MNGPRIAPRPLESWDTEVREALSILSPGGASAPARQHVKPDVRPPRRAVPNIIGIFAWHPALTRSWLTFSEHLRYSTLPDRVRELVILRTVWLRHGEYEWAQHTRMARDAGLSHEEVEAITEGPAKVWGSLDAAVLRAVDEICSGRRICDTTWAELAAHLDRKQLMDLVFTIGAYDMHCMAFNTFGLEPDPGMAGFGTPA